MSDLAALCTSILVDMEEDRLCNDCMADACEKHDEMPEVVIGCGDGADLAARLHAAGVRVTGDAALTLAPTPADALREALREIREITRPFSMTMSGPQWFSGDTDIFRGGNREKVWRIADAALATEEQP